MFYKSALSKVNPGLICLMQQLKIRDEMKLKEEMKVEPEVNYLVGWQ